MSAVKGRISAERNRIRCQNEDEGLKKIFVFGNIDKGVRCKNLAAQCVI